MEPSFHTTIRLAALLAACAVLWLMETVIPLFRYRPRRWQRITPNLVLALLVVLVNLAMASWTAWLLALLTRNHMGLLSGLRSHPVSLALLGVAGLDLFAYVAHRLLHKVPFVWKFHRVHHSELEVDVTTAFRQHPGETLWRVLWQLLAALTFGLPFWIVVLYQGFSSLSALWEHANIRIDRRLEAWLGLLIVTPNMHKIHHSRRAVETDSNYSNILSVWDRLGRTYAARASHQGLRYGLDGFDDDKRHTVGGLLRMPF